MHKLLYASLLLSSCLSGCHNGDSPAPSDALAGS